MEKFVLNSAFETLFPEESFGKIVLDALKKREPNEAAMIDGITNEILTNQQLLDGSIKLAIALQKMGIGKNDVIALISANCLNYYIPIIATISIGAIINLINHDYKAAEVTNVFNISKPKLVITSEACAEMVKGMKERFTFIENVISLGKASDGIIGLDEVLKLGEGDDGSFQPLEVDIKEQACMILCSSGTTGLPKGVMITHNNLRTAMTYIIDKDLINMTSKDSTIGLMPFYHTFGNIVSFGCIISGAKQVVLPKFKPDLFLKAIQEHKITQLFIVPPLVLFLAKSPMVDDYDLSSLSYIFCAAASLGQEIQVLVEKRLNVNVKQGYGLTEAGGIVTLDRSSASVCKAGSSGTVVYNACLKVVGIENRKPLGPDELGEILIKSEMNMKGYMNNEEATRNAFDESGFLKTGDIGYYDEDGYFFIVDRLKELIKYKGFQVPPAELENILVSHKCIKDAGVIGLPDEKCGELAMAFVVKEPNCEVSEEEIKKFVAEYVSVPKQLHGGVRFVEELPKNPTGKLLRRKLRELVV